MKQKAVLVSGGGENSSNLSLEAFVGAAYNPTARRKETGDTMERGQEAPG